MPKRKPAKAQSAINQEIDKSAYFKSKRYTEADLDEAKQEARDKSRNEQSALERDAFHLIQLDREIQELETTLHSLKMKHKDAHASYTKSLSALTRKLDSLI